MMKKVSVILGSVYMFILFLTMRQVGKTQNNEEDTGRLSATLEENLRLLGDKEKVKSDQKDALIYPDCPPQIQSALCSLPQCPEGCDVCCNLPYNHNSKQMAVHHWLAQTGN